MGKAARKTLQVVGLGVGLIGVVATFAHLQGAFLDQEKLEFAQLIRETKNGIPRQTPGFDKFLSDFPPPNGVSPEDVAFVTKDVIQTHDQFKISTLIRYVAQGKRTQVVASLNQVASWSHASPYGWISAIVAAIGWALVTISVVLEFAAKRQRT